MKSISNDRHIVGATAHPTHRIVSVPVASVLLCKPMNALRASKLFEHSSAETASTNCDVSAPIVCRGLRLRQGGKRPSLHHRRKGKRQMTDPKGNERHHHCWHQILYALVRWTFPAVFVAIPGILVALPPLHTM